MTKQGSLVLASLFKGRTDTYVAVGKMPEGQTEWVSPPPEDINAITLLNEIGRHRVTLTNYVEQDPLGVIGVNNIYYNPTLTPTNLVYVKFVFDVGNAGSERVCQFGIFTEVTKQIAIPGGQNYLLPAEVLDSGKLFFNLNVVPFTVDPLKKLTFDTVIRF